MKVIQHWVDNKQWAGSSSRSTDVYNPALGAKTASLALASAADIDHAVQRAAHAFPAWADTPPAKRAAVMFKFRELIIKHMDELAQLLSSEHGKTIPDAKGEIARGLEVVEFVCGIPHLLKGEFSDQVANAVDSHSLRQPLGVVAGITPFNFPAMVPMWMYPVAIACGNTFVLNPSERDPSVPLRLAEQFAEAGLPAGVFNVVNGDKEAVDALLDHPDVQAISFVGSTANGHYIYSRRSAS
ncbi:MAG: aldehyde dehydrogenase family protein, partial [Burkholderiaceae bacterium]